MSYTVQLFPMPTFSGNPNPNNHLAKVENSSGKICKFAVFVSPNDRNAIEFSCRTPTPGFPAKNEMTNDEVQAELPAMLEAIKNALNG